MFMFVEHPWNFPCPLQVPRFLLLPGCSVLTVIFRLGNCVELFYAWVPLGMPSCISLFHHFLLEAFWKGLDALCSWASL